jgi:hypothetical protein
MGLASVIAVGCSKAEPSGSSSGGAPPGAEKGADKKAKYDCELVYSFDIGGAKASGTHRLGRSEGESTKSTHTVGKSSVAIQLAFVEHRDGKDIYKSTYTITDGGGSQTRSSQAGYEGKRLVIVEDKYGTAALQPVTKETPDEKR